MSSTEPDVAYLTTSGRITGAAHRIEIWFARAGSTVFLLSGEGDRADWVRNIMVSPEVVLQIGDRKRPSRARLITPGTDEDALARSLLVTKYAGEAGDLASWGASALPVAIDWPD